MGKLVSAGKRTSLLAGQAEIAPAPNQPITFCFAHLDLNQGHTLDEWHKRNLLAKMIDRFRGFDVQPLHKCLNDKFKRYRNFPPKSAFKHPPRVPPDAEWASMHLGNLPCVIGHVIHNVFYVVFLDGDHKFWPVEK